MMRSIYITNFSNKAKTLKEKQELSVKMRHSVATAEKNYVKVLSSGKDENKKIEELQKENDMLNVEITQLRKLLEMYQPDDTAVEKRRKDILYRLNKLKASVKHYTIERYKIKYDEDAKVYV